MTRAAKIISEAIGTDAKFILVELTAEGPRPVYDGDGNLLKFSTGVSASSRARELSGNSVNKVQVRAINDVKWRDREQQRTAKGYLPLPWEKECWWLGLKDVWGDHYPHVSIEKGAMIAFTEDEGKGSADIQTRIKPGRYLERYFGTILNKYVIRDLCSIFSSKYEDNLLMFADTADEIEEVFTTGPNSCMSKNKGEYGTPVHPATVYASPDLKVAYLKRDGKISARCVVWPDKKLYNVIYGDSSRLQPLLRKEGYKAGSPIGARLNRVKFKRNEMNLFVCPHVDGASAMVDDGDYLRVASDASDKRSFTWSGGAGVSEAFRYACTECKVDLPDRRVVSVYEKRTHSPYCADCCKQVAVRCGVSGYYVLKEHSTPLGNGHVWNREIERTFVCAGDGRRWLNGDGVIASDGQRYSHVFAHKNMAVCKCGKYTPKSSPCDGKCPGAKRMNKDLYAGTATGTTYVTFTTSA